MNEQPSYYAIIPSNVRYDNRLKANEKLMYGEITCLTQSTGECFASNNYFANLYEVSVETVSRWISNLKKCGYIEVIITYKEDKSIDKRIITLLTKRSIPPRQKDQYPIDKKIKDNNTRDNNTSIIEKINKKDLPEDLNIDAFNMWIDYKGSKYSKQGRTLSINKLIKYPKDIQMQMVENSIMNNYKGLFEVKQNKSYNKPDPRSATKDLARKMFGTKQEEVIECEVING